MYRFSLTISFLFKNNININKGACLIKQKRSLIKFLTSKLKLFKNLPHFNFAITGTTQ